MICRVSAEMGSLGSGPTLCGTVPQCVVQSQVDAVWSSSQRSGPVPQGVACRGIVGFLLKDMRVIGRVIAELGSLWSGPTLCVVRFYNGWCRAGRSTFWGPVL